MKRAVFAGMLACGLLLSGCRTSHDGVGSPSRPTTLYGPVVPSGARSITVHVDVTEGLDAFTMDTADDNADGNSDPARHKVKERQDVIVWKFDNDARRGSIATFTFENRPEYDFVCEIGTSRKCESRVFAATCTSNGCEDSIKYTIWLQHKAKSGEHDPWVVIEK